MAFLHLFIVSGWVFISSVIKGLVFVCILMLFLVGLASVSIDFYFLLNSFFLRAKVAIGTAKGSLAYFFPREGFPSRVLPAETWGQVVDFGFEN